MTMNLLFLAMFEKIRLVEDCVARLIVEGRESKCAECEQELSGGWKGARF